MVARRLMRIAAPELPDMPKALAEHAEFACESLQRMALEISSTMSRFQLKLADRQCRMAELSLRCQDFITILATSMYAGRHEDVVVAGRGRHPLPKPPPKTPRPPPLEPILPPRHRPRRRHRDGQFKSIAGLAPRTKFWMRYE